MNVAFDKARYSTRMLDHQYGGAVKGMVRMTNAEQIASYNQLLDWASAGSKGAAARAGGAISADSLDRFKIGVGSRNMVEINGLTPDMRNQLAGTSFARNTVMSSSSPERNLEDAPAQLTVKAAQ